MTCSLKRRTIACAGTVSFTGSSALKASISAWGNEVDFGASALQSGTNVCFFRRTLYLTDHAFYRPIFRATKKLF